MVTKSTADGDKTTFTFNAPSDSNRYLIVITGTVNYKENESDTETKTASNKHEYPLNGTSVKAGIDGLSLKNDSLHIFNEGIITEEIVKNFFKNYKLNGTLENGSGSDPVELSVKDIKIFNAVVKSGSGTGTSSYEEGAEYTTTQNVDQQGMPAGYYYARLYPELENTYELRGSLADKPYYAVLFGVAEGHLLKLASEQGETIKYNVVYGDKSEGERTLTTAGSYVKQGGNVSFTITPAQGKTVQGVTAAQSSDNTQALSLTESTGTDSVKTYSFTMPDCDVTITVTYSD